MHSLRKWLYRPKRTDTSLLAQFYYADDELNTVAEELDSFDGRKDPDRCTTLVNQLRTCQNRVLNICNRMMDEVIGDDRASRDFRVKFPDDVLQENLAGQLWFGAECLAAGSCIMNRESESAGMRPLAKAVTKSLDSVRVHLREQCLKAPQDYTEQLCETLKIFDRLFAEFELRYVSAMVPVKSTKEYSLIQDVVTLFSETVQRALRLGLLCQEQLDLYDPALMFTIPRLAIVAGLVVFPDGPLRLDRDITLISELFRPFKNLLCKIRELLWALSKPELFRLERCLCSVDEPTDQLPDDDHQLQEAPADAYPPLDIETFIAQFYALNPGCRRSVSRSAWRETEARLRQTHHRRGRGPPPPPRRRGARSDAPPPVPVPQSVGTAVVDPPVAAPRLHRVRSIPCDYGSRAEQRRELESDMRALLTSLVDSAVLSSEQHRHSTPAATSTAASTTAPSTAEPSDPADHAVDLQRHPSQPVQHGSRQTRRRGLHSSGGTGTPGCCTQSPLDAVQFTQPRVCENGVTAAVTSSSSESEDESHDSDREIALAIQAAEAATRNRARARFKDSQDLTHRLFVCISGVADQLQTNFASDLRHILKVVFQINATPEHDSNGDVTPSCVSIDSAEDALSQSADDSPPATPSGTETRPSASVVHPSHLASNMRVVGDHMEAEVLVHGSIGITAQSGLVQRVLSSAGDATDPRQSPAASPVTVPARLAAALEPPPPDRPAAPPDWVPDRLASECMLCCAVFTVVRRRHHCRRCGGVFCRRCSAGALPLVQYGYTTAVRVCDTCLSAQQC